MPQPTTPLAQRIAVARGHAPCDLLLVNVQLVNVLTDEVYPVDGVAIHDGVIVGFGADRHATQRLDLGGQFLAPSLVDGHVHIESSMLCPAEFAKAVVPNGTGAVICDPHEIANVLGERGVKFMLEASERLPLDVYVMVPSCVPATPLETAGARLSAIEVKRLLDCHPRVIGLAEMMNFPGVLNGDPDVMAKLEAAGTRPRDGHSPLLMGKDLSAYITGGIYTCHETTTADEALDKLRQGMYLQIREGSAAKNLRELLKVVKPTSARRCMFVSDDRHPADLLEDGHINAIVRDAIRLGIDPPAAFSMGAFNASRYYRLFTPPRGAVAVGFAADLIAFEQFETIKPSHVFKNGKLVAKDGHLLESLPAPKLDGTTNTIRLSRGQLPDLKIPAPAAGKQLRVIVAKHGSLITGQERAEPKIVGGLVVSDPSRDLLKLVVVERHTGMGRFATAFVRGIGLKRGALASSVAHDSHNLIAVGANDDDMRTALGALIDMQGGLVAVADGQVLAKFALPVAGLMSAGTVEAARDAEHALNAAATSLGCVLPNAFMTLSFLALPPIPDLKLTDHGLVDVGKFAVVPMFE